MAYAHYAGIDVAVETHALAALGTAFAVPPFGTDRCAMAADGAPSLKPTPFAEDRDGYAPLSAKLDGLRPVLVVMEATGHYWRNRGLDSMPAACLLAECPTTRDFAQAAP